MKPVIVGYFEISREEFPNDGPYYRVICLVTRYIGIAPTVEKAIAEILEVKARKEVELAERQSNFTL